ncbi:MAG: tetraacyldisaccharide 4'-kinase [Candidatus Aminicenantes bacterium]|jgi:tetraacyldisaccharide 4'-kinase
MLPLLFPLYWLYRVGGQIKNLLYGLHVFRTQLAPIPILSVGNISFGGSNKTPLALNLLTFLKEQGFKPALISRGYRGNWERRGGILSDGKTISGSWQDSGDEPYMAARSLPAVGVFIGKNRWLSCKKAKNIGFDVAVLDDGFQHRRLKRDVDIVLFNPVERVALREPISSLKRAQIVLVEKKHSSALSKRFQKKAQKAHIFFYSIIHRGFFDRADKEKESHVDDFKEKKILAFSGIARPDRFFSLLTKLEIRPCSILKFPDHHPYPHTSVKKIIDTYKTRQADSIITTEKDFVKIEDNRAFQNIPVFYLKIDLNIDKAFYDTILTSLNTLLTENK